MSPQMPTGCSGQGTEPSRPGAGEVWDLTGLRLVSPSPGRTWWSLLQPLIGGQVEIGGRRFSYGVTLVELLIVVALMGMIMSIAVPYFKGASEEADKDMAAVQINNIDQAIQQFLADFGRLPVDLDEAGYGEALDSWGNPFEYLPFDVGGKKTPPGKKRKDRFLVPLNTDYDLYSSGPDGQSVAPLTAQASRDDIVRANNGAYLGPAADY